MMLKGEDEHWCSERRKESEKGAKWKKIIKIKSCLAKKQHACEKR